MENFKSNYKPEDTDKIESIKPQEITLYRTEVTYNAKNAEAGDIVTKERFEQLGLEQIFFKVHSTKALSEAEVREKIKEPDAHVYVLLHGWTGTNEIFDKVHKQPSGNTIVEEILSQDPNAIIITPDALGFGKTKFKELNTEELIQKCSPDNYADEVEFILSNILKIDDEDKKKIFVLGHSWGGATTMLMAAKGYVREENCIAVCPALIPTENAPRDIKLKYLKTRATYKFLGEISNVGTNVGNQSETSSRVVDSIIQSKSVDKSMELLMGVKKTGELQKAEMRLMYEELASIHKSQIEGNLRVTSAVMKALSKGINLKQLLSFGKKVENSSEILARLAQISVVVGTHDNLAPSIVSHTNTRNLAYEINPMNGNLGGVFVVNKAGHYAPLYSEKENDPISMLINRAYEAQAEENLYTILTPETMDVIS